MINIKGNLFILNNFIKEKLFFSSIKLKFKFQESWLLKNIIKFFKIKIKNKINIINLKKFFKMFNKLNFISELLFNLVIYIKITINPPIIINKIIKFIHDFLNKFIFKDIIKVIIIKIKIIFTGWKLLNFIGIDNKIKIIIFKIKG